MSELALRSRIAASRAARVYGAGSVTDFSALAGGRHAEGAEVLRRAEELEERYGFSAG